MENTFGMNIIPENDELRIAALRRYKILDTPPEGAFNNVATLATQIFKVPISLISLVDEDEVYFKANIGMGDACSTKRGVSLCSLAVLKPEVTVFENAPDEPCLLTNPNVAGDFGLKFYAGAPLTTHDGFRIGTLCIIDKVPRSFDIEGQAILKGLAKIVIDEIELRLSSIIQTEKQQNALELFAAVNEELSASNEELSATNEDLEQVQQNLIQTNVKLADSEELKAIAIEQAQLGIWYVDAVTRDFVPSVRLKEFFGYGPDETMPYNAAVHQIRDDYRDKVMKAVDLAISKGNSYDLEYPILEYRTQKLRWVRATGKLNPAESGRDAYFSGTVIDITEQKLDDQRKNDFISMVSHELKTPLTSLNGYIQMLQLKAQKSGDTFASGVLDRAKNQAKKMIVMIDDFLNMKRLETGKIPLNIQTFDMAELVKDCEEEILSTVTTHELIFAPVEFTSIQADRDKIGQVIGNLISNAVKYSPAGSTINIACINLEQYALVSVKDNGMGISETDIKHLFERFYRVENEEMKSINGFGIGLYLCDEIVQRHGGTIWVESELEKGSTFFVKLPLWQLPDMPF